MSLPLFRKIAICFVAGLTFAALVLVLGNSGTIHWLPPIVVFSLVVLSLVIAVIFPFVWQAREAKQKINTTAVSAFLVSSIRYCIAFNMASFGWKKIFGLQFIVPADIANKPMNQQAGEWLTWYYFGFSPAFGLIIATLQIGASCLILFRRTELLGVVILFSLLLNLLLINIFYEMNAGALLQSVILTIGALFLLLLEYKSLVAFFLIRRPNLPLFFFSSAVLKNIIRASAIVLSLLFVLYLKVHSR